MTKLKVYGAAVAAAVLLGAGGIAYRAAGQAPRSEARPLTELELLRREVDILKLQMELVQEKQRAQEAELRALKGRGGPTKTAPGSAPGVRPPAAKVPTELDVISPPARDNISPVPPVPEARPAAGAEPKAKSPPPATGPVPGALAPSADVIPPLPATGPPVDVSVPVLPPAPVRPGTPQDLTPSGSTPPLGAAPPDAKTPGSADRELEAAVKAFREARDEGARQRAVDAMEKALRDLRQQQRPAAPPAAR